jgi:adenylylsulfate kinase
MTGLPASGKSTITRALVAELAARGVDVAVLESDALRPVLTPRATYSEEERETFYRAMTYIGALLVTHGVPVIFDATANRRAYRAGARVAIERFVEVYVDCPLDVCIGRDPKGIYRKAQVGQASTVPACKRPMKLRNMPMLSCRDTTSRRRQDLTRSCARSRTRGT